MSVKAVSLSEAQFTGGSGREKLKAGWEGVVNKRELLGLT